MPITDENIAPSAASIKEKSLKTARAEGRVDALGRLSESFIDRAKGLLDRNMIDEFKAIQPFLWEVFESERNAIATLETLKSVK